MCDSREKCKSLIKYERKKKKERKKRVAHEEKKYV